MNKETTTTRIEDRNGGEENKEVLVQLRVHHRGARTRDAL